MMLRDTRLWAVLVALLLLASLQLPHITIGQPPLLPRPPLSPPGFTGGFFPGGISNYGAIYPGNTSTAVTVSGLNIYYTMGGTTTTATTGTDTINYICLAGGR